MKKLFRKNDLIVIAVILAAALVLLIPNLSKKQSLTATVYADGEIVKTINLDEVKENYTFSPKDGTEIRVENGAIYFTSAVCRDKLCINSGKLYKNGQTAACLPERIVISISSGKNSPDMLTY